MKSTVTKIAVRINSVSRGEFHKAQHGVAGGPKDPRTALSATEPACTHSSPVINNVIVVGTALTQKKKKNVKKVQKQLIRASQSRDWPGHT